MATTTCNTRAREDHPELHLGHGREALLGNARSQSGGSVAHCARRLRQSPPGSDALAEQLGSAREAESLNPGRLTELLTGGLRRK